MLAVVEIAGGQYEVAKSQKLIVPRLEANEGDIVEFTKIYMFNNDGNLIIGQPFVEGKVTARVLGEKRDKKVLVFHKKRRKGYQKLNGHRQRYTQIEILDIIQN